MLINPVKRAYLALESWFNLSFGPDWNPLYHLGTLTFFFFWVVLVSGIYLFIPFHGSIDGAYASVEWMTHEQWYAAGIMRSLHRYASDAAVVTVLLHMFREFAQGRYRSFRWYSWFTGVPMLWMLVLLGITGYWLVWDELALYVALGSARLIDALPISFGSMTRNFLEGGLTDRFFILIEFLHLLGQPIVLVFGLWIHVRRLSNVNINPPRGLAIGCFLALLALSLAKPALSNAPADLSSIPQVLNLDWFYLNVYPLLDHWTGGQTWMLTIGITMLLMMLPWLPPQKTGAAAEVNLSECNGCGQCFDDCPFDAISLQARTDGARHKHEVVVHPQLCAACGICVGSCHKSNPFRQAALTLETAIDMPQFPIDAVRAKTRTALATLEGDAKVLVFGCEHSFDVSQLSGSDTVGISLFCTGMAPPALIEFALSKGADGVMVVGCREVDCFYRFGNRWMRRRLDGERKPYLRDRADPRRILVQGAAETDRNKLVNALTEFKARLISLDSESEPAKVVEGND